MKKAVLLINIGTPDRPDKKAVKKYLTEFLNDKYVIDIPWLLRKILVNLIIIPFRVKNSTSLYQKLWTDNGSALLYYQNSLVKKLNKKYGNEFAVFSAMRYGNPSLEKMLKQIYSQGYQELIIFPMYPQYATSTTLSTQLRVENLLAKNKINLKLRFIEQFYKHPSFINSFVKKIQNFSYKEYDHVVFSFHGLPNRQVEKLHPDVASVSCPCSIKMPDHGHNCYKATCYETSRLLAKELNLKKEDYSVSFQSRLSNNWLTPFTDKTLMTLLAEGKKKILVVAPAFVTDCLETIIEISLEYKEMFINNGGVDLAMVASLNDDDVWVDAIYDIVQS